MTARIKWFDKRDCEGIAVDRAGNEYYFNHSAEPSPDFFNDMSDGIKVWIADWGFYGGVRCVTLFG